MPSAVEGVTILELRRLPDDPAPAREVIESRLARIVIGVEVHAGLPGK
ncbi:MAG: hypothetical protein ACRDOK_08845 [Streptosporangiaceae bacterium]